MTASASLDGRIDFTGTFAQLVAAATGGLANGTQANTSDLGRVYWNSAANAWEMITAVDGLTASATQTQAAGVALSASMNRIATCAIAGNAATLRLSAPGMQIDVTNAGTASCNVFPGLGDSINALGANTAFALGAGKSVTFACYTAGQWHTIPLVP